MGQDLRQDLLIAPPESRLELATLKAQARGLSREEFGEVHPHPLLVDFGSVPGHGRELGVPAVTAVIELRPRSSPSVAAAPSLTVYEVRKRAGSNPFAGMVTLGRAPNNDIVVGYPAISAFHACFAERSPGEWTLTDSSTNGTWLDGRRLMLRQAYPVPLGSTLRFASTVVMSFLAAREVYDMLEAA
jgi:hypothetical protein